MKKTGLLLLLTPTLFLASCQTTPKIDTIDEKEARAFIEEHFTKEKFEVAPDATSKIKWEIKSTDEAIKNDIKTIISKYIYSSDGRKITDDKNTAGLPMDDAARLSSYLTELDGSVESFGTPGTDAVIGMNKDIFEKLYKSGQREVGTYNLIYKLAGKGLRISSESAVQNTIYTRTHYYNEVGQETKFEINANKNNSTVVFTMSIDFKY